MTKFYKNEKKSFELGKNSKWLIRKENQIMIKLLITYLRHLGKEITCQGFLYLEKHRLSSIKDKPACY